VDRRRRFFTTFLAVAAGLAAGDAVAAAFVAFAGFTAFVAFAVFTALVAFVAFAVFTAFARFAVFAAFVALVAFARVAVFTAFVAFARLDALDARAVLEAFLLVDFLDLIFRVAMEPITFYSLRPVACARAENAVWYRIPPPPEVHTRDCERRFLSRPGSA
jgi:hypothetical protein